MIPILEPITERPVDLDPARWPTPTELERMAETDDPRLAQALLESAEFWRER